MATDQGRPTAAPVGAARRGRDLIAEYVRFQYTSGHLALIGYVRALPHDARAPARFGLALAGLTILATPLLATLASVLGGVSFPDTQGVTRTISVPALVLALVVFSVSWGYLLAALAQGPGGFWVFGGLRYAFGMLAVGLAAGRSFWHLVPAVLPVVVGALTDGDHGRAVEAPSPRRPAIWATAALAVLLTGMVIRVSPLPDGVRALWYVYCLPLAVPLIFLHRAVARSIRVPMHGRALAVAVVSLAYFGMMWNLAGAPDLTRWFTIMLDNLTFWLQIVWFVLGAAFVASAIEFGQFVRKAIGVVAPEPVPIWTLLVAWGLAVAWLGIPADPGPRIGTLFLLGVACVVMAWRWRRSGITREWLAGWLVASLAGLLIIKFLSGYDAAEFITREAGALSIIGFVYALLWDVTGRIPTVPLRTRWFARPAPLVLYLGMILLTGAAALFGIAAGVEFFQTVVVVNQYLGAITLWIPMVLLVLARSWPRIPGHAVERFIAAFILGMLAGVPMFLARATGLDAPDSWIIGIALLIVALLLRRWPEAADPLVAGGIGASVVFGLAVHAATGIPTVFLNGVFITLGALFGVQPFLTVADAIWRVSRPTTPDGAMLFSYFWMAPLVVGLVAAAGSRVLARLPLRSTAAPVPQGGEPVV